MRWRRKEEEEEEYEDEGGGGLIQVFLSVDNAAQLGTREEKHERRLLGLRRKEQHALANQHQNSCTSCNNHITTKQPDHWT